MRNGTNRLARADDVNPIEIERRKDARTVTLTIAFIAVAIGALAIVALDIFLWRP